MRLMPSLRLETSYCISQTTWQSNYKQQAQTSTYPTQFSVHSLQSRCDLRLESARRLRDSSDEYVSQHVFINRDMSPEDIFTPSLESFNYFSSYKKGSRSNLDNYRPI